MAVSGRDRLPISIDKQPQHGAFFNSVGVFGGFCGFEAAGPASFVGAGVGVGLGGETLGGVVLVLACQRKWMSILLW